jgi:hypothetical protein
MGEETMIARKLLIGAFSAAVFMGAFAAAGDASAEMAAPKKKGGGVGICVSKPQPICNLFLHAVCVKKSKCGGCLEWKCQGYPQKK